MYIDGRTQIKVYTDELTQVHSAQSSLVVTQPSTNQAHRYLTSVTSHRATIDRHCGPQRNNRRYKCM